MPVHASDAPLEAVLDFYSSIVTLTAEGDSMVSEETLEGLGTTGFLLQSLFGSILRIASPLDNERTSSETSGPGDQTYAERLDSPVNEEERLAAEQIQRLTLPKSPEESPDAPSSDREKMEAAILQSYVTALDAARADERAAVAKTLRFSSPATGTLSDPTAAEQHQESKVRQKKTTLTYYVPDPGYFVAGAVAGGISRTATAPLDRLKVYLLVNTRSSSHTTESRAALKQGRPVHALLSAGRPFRDAFVDMWRAGGIRSLFAGKLMLFFGFSPKHALRMKSGRSRGF